MASYIQDPFNCRKLALIIGNGDYHRSENRLNSSINNAKELSNLLKTINFEVETNFNPDTPTWGPPGPQLLSF